MQSRKEADQEAMRVDRDMSTRKKPSRLRGKGRGTGQYDQSVKFKLGEANSIADLKAEDDYKNEIDADVVGIPGDIDELGNEIGGPDEDEVNETFVNEHESVDNFLDMYKEFKVRGEKK